MPRHWPFCHLKCRLPLTASCTLGAPDHRPFATMTLFCEWTLAICDTRTCPVAPTGVLKAAAMIHASEASLRDLANWHNHDPMALITVVWLWCQNVHHLSQVDNACLATQWGAKWPFFHPTRRNLRGKHCSVIIPNFGGAEARSPRHRFLTGWVSRPHLGNANASSPIEKHFVLPTVLYAVRQPRYFLATISSTRASTLPSTMRQSS
ncbi:hypothetical protein EDB86DRAFT_630691 [Lactarius hatsudake]|nr:hypothetical protein EDB86DRAFT_630691 [Lactarius hatsudake]